MESRAPSPPDPRPEDLVPCAPGNRTHSCYPVVPSSLTLCPNQNGFCFFRWAQGGLSLQGWWEALLYARLSVQRAGVTRWVLKQLPYLSKKDLGATLVF